MFFRTSGNSAETSLPKVMDIIVFWMASLRSYAYCDTSPALNSKVSPFLGAAKAPLILFTAISHTDGDLRFCPSYTPSKLDPDLDLDVGKVVEQGINGDGLEDCLVAISVVRVYGRDSKIARLS